MNLSIEMLAFEISANVLSVTEHETELTISSDEKVTITPLH